MPVYIGTPPDATLLANPQAKPAFTSGGLYPHLQRIIILRPVVLTPLLAFAAFPAGQLSLRSLWTDWAAVYAVSMLHFVVARLGARPLVSLYTQIVSDLILTALLIHQFTGPNSPFVPLFLLVITYASLLDQRRGGVISTLLSVACYLAAISLGRGISPSAALQHWGEPVPRLLMNLAGFAAVGYLGSSLSQRLQSMHRELDRKDGSLAELRLLHRNIIKSIRSGFATTDLKGRITSFNPAAEEITGIPEEEMLGQSCGRLIGERGLRRLERADFSRLKRGLRGETRLTNRAHRRRWLGFSIYPLNSPTGSTLGYTISFQDLTQIKKLEQRVRLKDRMATIGTLAAGIAHELRNPLGAIAGSVQVLKGEMSGDADRRQLLDIVLDESGRLNKIIENLLHYTRLDGPSRSSVRVDRLLEETLQLMRNDPLWAAVRIRVQSAPALPPCLADPGQVKQIFWNVLSNAAKAMPDGGEVGVRLWAEGRFLKMAFRDSGVGMTPGEQMRMFQPFVRGFERGSGLGMTIVYQIVQAHQGKIGVQSRRGHGTTITVALPLDDLLCESPALQSGASASDRRYSVAALP